MNGDTIGMVVLIALGVLWLLVDGFIIWFGGALHDARQRRAFDSHSDQALRIVRGGGR